MFAYACSCDRLGFPQDRTTVIPQTAPSLNADGLHPQSQRIPSSHFPQLWKSCVKALRSTRHRSPCHLLILGTNQGSARESGLAVKHTRTGLPRHASLAVRMDPSFWLLVPDESTRQWIRARVRGCRFGRSSSELDSLKKWFIHSPRRRTNNGCSRAGRQPNTTVDGREFGGASLSPFRNPASSEPQVDVRD